MMTTGSYELLMQQALAASQANDVDNAIRLWSEVSQCDPSSPMPHLLLGAELAQCGRIAEAEAAFANAILLSPALLIARFQLGLLQFTSGRIGIALLTWKPIVEADVHSALSSFVEGFAALARDDFAVAIAAFEAGIERNTDNAPLNADIRMVIAKTRALESKALPGHVDLALGGGATRAAHSDEHVLLANYQQYGLPH